QSSEARKKAADLGVQVDGIEAKLVPLRQDQQVAQANSELLNKALKSFDSQLQASEQNWAAVQKQIEAVNQMSRLILGPAPNEAAAPPAESTESAAVEPPGEGGAAPAPAPAPASRPAAGGAGPGPVAPMTPVTVVGKLRWLGALTTSIQSQRAEAETLLGSAITHYHSPRP